jgi:uncharacterized tellurite resistance protein B-like protein
MTEKSEKNIVPKGTVKSEPVLDKRKEILRAILEKYYYIEGENLDEWLAIIDDFNKENYRQYLLRDVADLKRKKP